MQQYCAKMMSERAREPLNKIMEDKTMKTEKKIEIITRALNNFMTGMKISRDMDIDETERVNPYDLEEGESKFAADTVSAMYGEAMHAAMIVASNMIMNCAQEQRTI